MEFTKYSRMSPLGLLCFVLSVAFATDLSGNYYTSGNCGAANDAAYAAVTLTTNFDKCQKVLPSEVDSVGVRIGCRKGMVVAKVCSTVQDCTDAGCVCSSCDDYAAWNDGECIRLDANLGDGNDDSFYVSGCAGADTETCMLPLLFWLIAPVTCPNGAQSNCLITDDKNFVVCIDDKYPCLKCNQGYYLDNGECKERKDCDEFGCGYSRIGFTCSYGLDENDKICQCPGEVGPGQAVTPIGARNNCKGGMVSFIVPRSFWLDLVDPLLAITQAKLDHRAENHLESFELIADANEQSGDANPTMLSYRLNDVTCDQALLDAIDERFTGIFGRQVTIDCGSTCAAPCTFTVTLSNDEVTANYNSGASLAANILVLLSVSLALFM